MIPVSNAFQAQAEERTNFLCSAVVTFADGRTLILHPDDFTIGNNSLVDAAGAAALPMGMAISRTIQIELENSDDRYAPYAFYNAEIAMGLVYELDDGTEESVRLGTFTVISPETYGETVRMTAQDDMYKADETFSGVEFPASLSSILSACCAACGITPASTGFPNSSFRVSSAPEGEFTYRSVIGWIAMLAGGNARINRDRQLEILPYDFDALAKAQAGETVSLHDLVSWITLNLDTEDIEITGIRMGTRLYGTDGYYDRWRIPLVGASWSILPNCGPPS